MHSPADASRLPSRAETHGLGPMRVATPSSCRTCTDYSLPVSRRTNYPPPGDAGTSDSIIVSIGTTEGHMISARDRLEAILASAAARYEHCVFLKFKSPRSAQRFLSLHAATYNVFTVPRHLVSARTHRLFRAEAFEAWRNAAGVPARHQPMGNSSRLRSTT
jgi:hypothetical protein